MNKDNILTYINQAVIAFVVAAITVWGGLALFAQTRGEIVQNTDRSERRLPLTVTTSGIPDVVELAIPGVVSIVISADVPVIEQYFEEYNGPFDLFGFRIPMERQVGTERQEIGGGSGFFVSEDGYIVTNRHVVEQEGVEYSIMANDGETYDVEIIAKDPSLDIAVLKVDANQTFTALPFGSSSELRLGEPVIAIGNALAEFPNSVSVGVVSGLSRNVTAYGSYRVLEELEGVIQTDAAINRGNSGGPLLNARGEVIGVNVAIAGGSENIGFALPSDIVKTVYDSVREYGKIVRPFLGVRYIEVTDELTAQNNITTNYGVLVVRGRNENELAVIPGSPADKAGIVENDVILEFDGQKLDGSQSLASIIRSKNVGDTVMLKVLHDGEEREMKVTLEQIP